MNAAIIHQLIIIRSLEQQKLLIQFHKLLEAHKETDNIHCSANLLIVLPFCMKSCMPTTTLELLLKITGNSEAF